MPEHDARELQEAKQWLARWVNEHQNTCMLMTSTDIDDIDARKLLDYHAHKWEADRIKGVSHE